MKYDLVNHQTYRARLDEILQRPTIMVALTNYCNFSCQYCATSRYNNKPVNIDMVLLEKIVTDCRQWGIQPDFGQTYEPLLHPRIAHIIRIVSDNGFVFYGKTNGAVLRKDLWDLPMDLMISISENAQDFNYRGSRLGFDRYIEGIRSFIAHRIENEISGTITVQFADYEFLEIEQMSYDKKISGVGAMSNKLCRFASLLCLSMPLDPKRLADAIQDQEYITLLDGDCRVGFAATKMMPSSYELTAESVEQMPEAPCGYCDSVFVMMSIQADGGVAYCCADPTAKTVCHYLQPNENLKDVWFGKKLAFIRKRFQEFNPLHPFCLKCLQPVSEHIKPLLTIKDPALVKRVLVSIGIIGKPNWL